MYKNFYWLVLIALISSPLAIATELGTSLTDVIVTFNPPSCDIKAPNEVFLGSIQNGTELHEAFNILVTCPETTKTAITATAINASLSSSHDTIILPNGSYFRLQENGHNIDLQGDENNVFCLETSIGERACSLRPVTEVHSTDKRGKIEAIINFKITYLA